MKIIFLDIDGVLNNSQTSETFERFCGIDVKLTSDFKRLVDKTGASIVLSSTWRESESSSAEVNRVLNEALIPSFIDITPLSHDALAQLKWSNRLSLGYMRGTEIFAWLTDHPEVDDFVILDDNEVWGECERSRAPDMTQKILSRFIKTDPAIGITEEDIDLAINILNNA